MTAALEGGEWSAARPGRTLPPRKTRYPYYRRLGGSQGRSGRVQNLIPNRDSIPDRPPCSTSLYLLRYPAHRLTEVQTLNLLRLFIKYRPFILWRGNERTCGVIMLIRLRTETSSFCCSITVLDNAIEARLRNAGLLTKRKYDKIHCVSRFNNMLS